MYNVIIKTILIERIDIMTFLFEILKIVLPAIITGIFGFLVAKYTYNNNKPLDKLEIAYNRVYYPLYNFIKQNNNADIDIIIEKAKYYFEKYDKYVDRSTLNIYNSLNRCDTKAKKKSIYNIFCNNIYDKNAYLRRRLGYLEPNFLQIYTYSSSSEKSTFRIFGELFIIYFCLILGSVTKDKIQMVVAAIFIIFIFILIIEVIHKFILFAYYKIKK